MKRLIFSLLIMLIPSMAFAQTANWITADDSTRNDRNVCIEFHKEFDLKKNIKKA